jgi:predicted nucleotidyltransferase
MEATRVRQYRRATAEKALAEVVKRIKEANENDDFIYYVDMAIVFGSFLNSEKEMLGDIDIAIYYTLKHTDSDEYELIYSRGVAQGLSVNDPAFLFCAEEEISRYIKNRKNVISLHDGKAIEHAVKTRKNYFDYVREGTHRIIYERKKPS